MTSVMTVGSTTVDFVFHIDEFPVASEKYKANSADIVLGGCAANAAVAISNLGATSYLAAEIGDDRVAEIVLDELSQTRVDTSLVRQVKEAKSSYSTVLVNATGERMIINSRGHGMHVNSGYINRAPLVDAVLVDSRWPAGAALALEMAREKSIPGIIDIEIGVDTMLLGKATHLAFSAQGIRSIYSGLNLREALEQVADKYGVWACVTDGEHGVLYTHGEQIKHMKAYEVSVVDTLGAGDVWHGAFALMLAEGASEESAIQFASATAALKCTKSGGVTSIPDRHSVIQFIKESKHAA